MTKFISDDAMCGSTASSAQKRDYKILEYVPC